MTNRHMSARQVTCFEVAGEVSAALRGRYNDRLEFYVLGDIPTAALASDGLAYDPLERRVQPDAEADLATVRPNGTRRDVDILLNTIDMELVAEAAVIAEEAAGGALRTDVFGIDIPRRTTWLNRTLDATGRYWTSRRELGPKQTVRHVLKPFSAEIPEVALDAWEVIPPHDLPPFPMVDPRYHMLCYDLRSIGGPRPKDREKLAPLRKLAHKMSQQGGARNTDYADLDAMAADIWEFRSEGYKRAFDEGELTYRIKSGVSYFAERQRWVVDAFQGDRVQDVVRSVVGAVKPSRR